MIAMRKIQFVLSGFAAHLASQFGHIIGPMSKDNNENSDKMRLNMLQSPAVP